MSLSAQNVIHQLHSMLLVYFLFLNTPPLLADTTGNTNGISIKNGWVRQAPPHMTIAAAYATIVNHTDTQKKLIAVSANPTFASAEIHTTKMVKSVIKMQRLPFLLIPPHQSVTLAPGQKHFMLLDRQRLLNKQLTLTLYWSDSSKSHITLPVKKYNQSKRNQESYTAHQH